MQRMQQEHRQEEPPAVWYRHPGLRKKLEGIGYLLAALLLASTLWSSQVYHFSMIGVDIFLFGAGLVASGVFLFFEVRKMQNGREEGFLSSWYQRPKLLKYLGQLLLCVSILSMLVEMAYGQAQSFSDTHFPWALITFFVKIFICLLGVAFYLYAGYIAKLQK